MYVMNELNPKENDKQEKLETEQLETQQISDKTSLDKTDKDTEQTIDNEIDKSPIANPVSREDSNQNIPKKQAENSHLKKYLIGLLIAILLVGAIVGILIYQTFFTRIQQPSQRLEIEKGQTYYSIINNWQSNAPLFSKTLAKLYIKAKIRSPLYMGAYELPKNPNLYETLSMLQQGANITLVKIQIVEGKTSRDLYKTLRSTKGIKITALDLPKEQLIKELGIPLTDVPNAIIEPTNTPKIEMEKVETETAEIEQQANKKTETITKEKQVTADNTEKIAKSTQQAEKTEIAQQNETIVKEETKKSDTEYFNYNLEGWFAPNTYFYTQGSTDKDILSDLYRRQKKILMKEWANRAEGLPYKTPYEALIMASIIEKETGIVEERPLVAGLFINRLKQNMRLQTDPTIIYGMGERYDGDIRKKDIAEKTLYNTYQINGLPPTPIALPSEGAIHSALHPAETDALYFVATGNDGHKFSKTYAEHQQAVAEYLKVMKEKEGEKK